MSTLTGMEVILFSGLSVAIPENGQNLYDLSGMRGALKLCFLIFILFIFYLTKCLSEVAVCQAQL